MYAASVAVVAVAGGFDIGIISPTSGAKPILLLLLLVPLRLALGGASALATPATAFVRSARARARSWPIPAAVQDALFALLITRVAALAAGFIANLLLLRERAKPFTAGVPWERFTETLTVFDSAWYIDIARRGYFFDPGGQSSIAFFPLYPLAIRLVSVPFGDAEAVVWTAGLAVSWLAFAAALVALHRLTHRLTGRREAARLTVLYITVFPFSFYFAHVYSESLFLLWTVLAVMAAQEGRWVRAGLFGALAAATRSNGIIIAVPLLLMAVSGRPPVSVAMRRLVALVPVPLAVAAYSGYVYTLTGDPLGWMAAQAHWGYSIGHMPYAHLLNTIGSIETQGFYAWLTSGETAPIDFSYTVVALLFLGLVPAVTRTFGLAFGAYVLVCLLIPLSGNVLVGIGRYASVLFPVFMLAGTVTSLRAQQAILVVSALLHALFLILFVAWLPLH